MLNQAKIIVSAALACLSGSEIKLPAAVWSDLGETHDLGAGITPGIAVDPAGTIHMVFMHAGKIHYRHAGRDRSWSEPESIPAPEGRFNFSSPHLVCDAAGALHLVFAHDFAGTSKRAWYATRQNGRWHTPVVVLDESGGQRRVNYPRIATDGTTAYVGGFVGGGSAIAKVTNLSSAPTVVRKIETRLWVSHPLRHRDELLVVGRAGAAGHRLEHYTLELEPGGEMLHLSHGTPTKTGEPTAAIIDESGVIHVAGSTGSLRQVLWYTTSERARAGRNVILGPELGEDIKEYTYPVILRDPSRRIYVSFRDNATGESRLTVLEPGDARFAEPITIGPTITKRLRWNAHLAAAPGGGAYLVWDAGERIYFRAAGEAAHGPVAGCPAAPPPPPTTR
jgi:hypothetical protein